MKVIKQTYEIAAPVEKVWQALVDPKIIDKWGGGPVRMTDKKGEKFTLWGGQVHGTNIEVILQKKLVQEWIEGKWDKPSIATFNLIKVDDENTRIDFTHEKVPEQSFKDIEQGWKDYYLGPLKDLLENRS